MSFLVNKYSIFGKLPFFQQVYSILIFILDLIWWWFVSVSILNQDNHLEDYLWFILIRFFDIVKPLNLEPKPSFSSSILTFSRNNLSKIFFICLVNLTIFNIFWSTNFILIIASVEARLYVSTDSPHNNLNIWALFIFSRFY